MGYDWPLGGAAPYKKKARYHGHRRQECDGGCTGGRPKFHHSAEEARYCNQLKLLVKSGEIKRYFGQSKYSLTDVHGKPCGYMMVDFEVTRADGKKEIHEYKGAHLMKTQEFRHKRALFSWCYPRIQYHTVGRGQIVL